MFDYVATDFSTGASEDSATQTELTISSIHRLSDEEELCILAIVNASIGIYLQESSAAAVNSPADKKGKGKVSDMEDSHLKVGLVLIQQIPKLLRKYGSEYSGNGQLKLIEVIKIIQHLDIGVYLELRLMTVSFCFFC
jgi:hypothetical protein